MKEIQTKQILRCLSLFGLIICAILAVWAWHSGLLTSRQAMSDFVRTAGFWGPALFLILQAVTGRSPDPARRHQLPGRSADLLSLIHIWPAPLTPGPSRWGAGGSD